MKQQEMKYADSCYMVDHELAPLDAAYRASVAYLKGLSSARVQSDVSLETLFAALDGGVPEAGLDAARVVDELVGQTNGGHNGSTGGRFFGWVIGGGLPSALAADWLVSTWDQNAAAAACGPAVAVIEEITGRWVKELLRLPMGASFAFTTGCQMAHVTCLMAARHALLGKAGWNVEEEGLIGAPSLRVVTSDQHHGSIERACQLLGIGRKAIKVMATNARGQVEAQTLAKILEGQGATTIVVLQAGDLNIGAFDRFRELIPIAREAGAWIHVDGAFGLWLRAGCRDAALDGVDLADSWATDAHKWLNVPYDCGIAVIADPAAHRAATATTASYLVHANQVRDQMDWTPEWSRRARSVPVYAALRQLGRAGLVDLLERTCRHAHAIVTRTGDLEGAEVVWEPTINQGLVRFLDETSPQCQEAHDRRTDQVIAAINASGEALFTGTTWRGRRAMRVSVCNWRTNEADVERVVAAARKAIAD